MKKTFTLLLVLGLFMAHAQPTINGTMSDGAYGAAKATTNANNCFGSTNTLGSLYYYYDASNIYVGVTGNTDGFNKIVIFFDFSGYGGRAAGQALNSSNLLTDFRNAKLGNEVDYAIVAGEDPNGTSYYVNAYRFGTTGGVAGSDYLGNVGSQTGTSASFATAGAWGGTGNMDIAYNGGGGATEGVEMKIPLTALPGVTAAHTVKIFAIITGGSGFGSNVSIPGMTVFPGVCGGVNADYSGGTPFTAALTLPVELTKFQAKRLDNVALITWTTASEKDNAYFAIERSTDGETFEKIGQIKGSGNTKASNDYQFTDRNPRAGVNYYRLKDVDFNGKETNSSVISVNFTDKSNHITLYPNPTKGNLTIDFTAETDITTNINIQDITGRVVVSQTVYINKGLNVLPINTTSLSAGLYFLKVNGETHKFVKN